MNLLRLPIAAGILFAAGAAFAAPAPNAPIPAPTGATPAPAHTAVAPTHVAAAPAPAGSPVFPEKVDPKYASLSAGKARMKSCLDQYHANKSTGGNAGLKWIQKSGYYSLCSKHLKAV